MATGELPVSENGLVVEIKYSQVQTKKNSVQGGGTLDLTIWSEGF